MRRDVSGGRNTVTLLWQIARIAAVLGALAGMVILLPDAPASLAELTIPDVVWDPLVAVLQLDRYFPIGTMLSIAGVTVLIKVGMAALWLYSWIAKHVFGG